jgi:hypothetical protein
LCIRHQLDCRAISVEQHARWLGAEPDPRDLLRHFQPHSQQRFVRRAEDPAIQRLFAFRPMRPTARFDRRPTLQFGVLEPAAHSRACENPHEYAVFARP